MLASPLILADFFVSDNDGLYTLFMIAAVGIAIVLIVTVSRQSRASDRRAHPPRHLAATQTPPEEISSPETPQ